MYVEIYLWTKINLNTMEFNFYESFLLPKLDQLFRVSAIVDADQEFGQEQIQPRRFLQ